MRIGIIGGAEKHQLRHHEALAAAGGCEVEFHHGHMRGRGPDELRALVARCDLVVIITRVNSHGAVQLARQLVRKYERRSLIVRRFGLHQLEELVRNQGEGRAA
jgi:hypothetical protein